MTDERLPEPQGDELLARVINLAECVTKQVYGRDARFDLWAEAMAMCLGKAFPEATDRLLTLAEKYDVQRN